MGRSWAVAAVFLLAACQAQEPVLCAPCLGPGAYVDVEGWMPALPFTVKACVREPGIACTRITYRRCHPGRACSYTVPPAAAPGARHRRPYALPTLGLDLGEHSPRSLDGRAVTVTITGPHSASTRTRTFHYYGGGECCGDQSFASARFSFARP